MTSNKIYIIFVKFLWETDKINPKCQIIKCAGTFQIVTSWIEFVCFPGKFHKNHMNFIWGQNRSFKFSIDGLIMCEFFQIVASEFAGKKIIKFGGKCSLNKILNFTCLFLSRFLLTICLTAQKMIQWDLSQNTMKITSDILI